MSHTYTITETAAIFGVSRDSIYKAVAKGELTGIRFGNRTVIPKRQVHELLGEPAPDHDVEPT